jgi:hypothetical protein
VSVVFMLAAGSLSACASEQNDAPTAQASTSSAGPSRDAGPFIKDVRMCISSIAMAPIKLQQTTPSGRKVLLKRGERQCFEGSSIELVVDVESTTPNKFFQVQATHNAFTTPAMAVCPQSASACYDDNNYFERGFVEGETGFVEAEGRGIEMTRLPDSDFKEFQVLITS